MKDYDLGIIVPLSEEFRILCECFPVVHSEVHDAIHYHTLQMPIPNCQVVAVVLGGMGKTRATHVTEKVLNHVRLKAIVLLGCQFTGYNVPAVYTQYAPPIYAQHVPAVYAQYVPVIYA